MIDSNDEIEGTPGTGRVSIREALLALAAYVAIGIAILWPAIPSVVTGQVLSCSAQLVANGPYPEDVRNPAPPSTDILSDSMLAYEPWLLYQAEWMAKNGRIPRWIDSVYCGAPFIGNSQSAVFYPLNYVMALLGAPPAALAWAVLAKLCAAALGTYLLARHLRMSRLGSFVAGCTFGFGGFSILYVTFSVSNVAALLPWLVLACDRCVLDPCARRILPIAILTGLQHLGGHPETEFHTQVFAAAMVLVRAFSLGGIRFQTLFSSRVLVPASGFVLGFVLAGVQLVPFFEYLLRSAALSQRTKSAPTYQSLLPSLEFKLYPFALLLAFFAARSLLRGPRLVVPALLFALGSSLALALGSHDGFDAPLVLQFAPDWTGSKNTHIGMVDYIAANGGYAAAALPLAIFGALASSRRALARGLAWIYFVTLLLGHRDPLVTTLIETLPVFHIAANYRFQCGELLACAMLAALGIESLGRASFPVRLRSRFVAFVLILSAAALIGRGTSIARGDPQTRRVAAAIRGSEPLRAESRRVEIPKGVTGLRFVGGWIAAGAELRSAAMLEADGSIRPTKLVELTPQARAIDPSVKDVAGPIYAYKATSPRSQDGRERKREPPYRILATTADGRTFLSPMLERPEGFPDWLLSLTKPFAGDANRQIAFVAIAFLVLLFAIGRTGRSLIVVRALLTAIVIVSFVSFGSRFLPKMKSDLFYPRSPMIDRLAALRPERFVLAPGSLVTFGADIGAAFGLLEPTGYDAVEDRRFRQVLDSAMQRETDDIFAIESRPLTFDRRLLGLMGVRAILHSPEIAVPGREIAREGARVLLTANPEHLPRARIVHRFLVANDSAALEKLEDPKFDIAGTCILEEPPGDFVAGTRGAAEITTLTPDLLSVTLRDHDGGLLVLADTFFPGWHARVDGKERPILRANVAFRAVPIAPQDRVVEFSYEPDSLVIGARVSAAGGIVFLLLAARSWMRRPSADRVR